MKTSIGLLTAAYLAVSPAYVAPPQVDQAPAVATKVAIQIIETSMGVEQRDAVLASVLWQKSHDPTLKLQVVDAYHSGLGRSTGRDDITLATVETLRKLAGEGIDIVIVGEVHDEFSSKVSEGFIMHRATAGVRIVDLRSQQTLFTLTKEVKAAGGDDARAGRAAFEKMAKDFAPEIVAAARLITSP